MKEHLELDVPVKVEKVFEWNTSHQSEFSRWRKVHFVPNGHILLT
jgi:hypothetical protein